MRWLKDNWDGVLGLALMLLGSILIGLSVAFVAATANRT